MIFLSGATIPLEIMPRAMKTLSNFLPLTHGINLLQAVSLGEQLTDFMFSFLVMGAIAVVGMVVSVRFFRWE
jgi:ABC-2 type transport system permease protein